MKRYCQTYYGIEEDEDGEWIKYADRCCEKEARAVLSLTKAQAQILVSLLEALIAMISIADQ